MIHLLCEFPARPPTDSAIEDHQGVIWPRLGTDVIHHRLETVSRRTIFPRRIFPLGAEEFCAEEEYPVALANVALETVDGRVTALHQLLNINAAGALVDAEANESFARSLRVLPRLLALLLHLLLPGKKWPLPPPHHCV